MCFAAQNRQKSIKRTLFWRLRSSKIIEFSGNREPVYRCVRLLISD